MPCYKPISLKRPNLPRGHLMVPCGRCIGCRLESSRQWAIRCMAEASLHKDNVFLTFTYRESELPWGNLAPTLVPRDLELFWKRLRKHYPEKKDENAIRYYAAGEYGERTRRPHYHACVFGIDFEDKKFFDTAQDSTLYTSDTLNHIWSHGNVIIGDVTFESAAYCARYITTKLTGPKKSYYSDLGIEPEFSRMSRRPGLGSKWYDKYQTDIFPRGHLLIRGKFSRPPRYFLDKLKRGNELEAIIQAARRADFAEKKYWKDRDNGIAPLSTRERVKKAQTFRLTRPLD